MKALSKLLTVALLLFAGLSTQAQQITKFVITDNISSKTKFGFAKPKPAAPKEVFTMLPDKGTQVLFYAELDSTKSPGQPYKLKFAAFRTKDGKEEWVDDRVIEVKATSTYVMAAINFFDVGSYKIVVTPDGDTKKVLSEGTFTVTQQ